MVFTTGLDIAIVLFLSAVFLKYSGYLDKRLKKPIGFVLAGAMFLLIDAVSGTWTSSYTRLYSLLTYIWQILAFILVLVGGLWATFEFTRHH